MTTSHRDPRLTALLGSPERDIQARRRVPGLLEEATPEALEASLAGVAATAGVGDLLRRARTRRGLTMRAAAQAAGRSPSRIAALEKASTDINVSTLVQAARALGYWVEVSLTPLDGSGERLTADFLTLLEEETTPQPRVALLEGSARVPARKARVER